MIRLLILLALSLSSLLWAADQDLDKRDPSTLSQGELAELFKSKINNAKIFVFNPSAEEKIPPLICSGGSDADGKPLEKVKSQPIEKVSSFLQKLTLGEQTYKEVFMSEQIFEERELKKELCFLSPEERIALKHYTHNGYKMINYDLRSGNPELIRKHDFAVKYINSALDKLSPFKGYLIRGISTSSMQYFKELTLDSEIIFPQFLSTSLDAKYILDFLRRAQVRFLIFSKSCRYIAPLSSQAREREVLCKPNTNFKVLYKGESNGLVDLVLTEI